MDFDSFNMTIDTVSYSSQKQESEYYLVKYITMGLSIGIIALFGIVTNLILIMVEIRNRRSLTSSIDNFVLNLSFADLIYLAIDSPVLIFSYVKTSYIFPTAFLCKAYYGIIVTLLFVRMYTFIPMLINHMRSNKKCNGINSRLPGSKLFVRFSIGFLWIFAIIQAVPVFIRTHVYPDINEEYYLCIPQSMDNSSVGAWIDLLSVIIVDILPLVILAVLVTTLIIIDQNKTIERNEIHSEGSKYLIIAIILQIVLHMPFSIQMMRILLGFDFYNISLTIAITLLKTLGHSINPVLFYYLRADFRNAVYKKSRYIIHSPAPTNNANFADNDQAGVYPKFEIE